MTHLLLLITIALMIFTPSLTNSITTSTELPNSSAVLNYAIDEIETLNYFIEFYPSNRGQVTTNYTLEFSSFGSGPDSNISVFVNYSNPEITYFNADYSYNMTFDNTLFTINSYTNPNPVLNVLLLGQKSELFANTSLYESSQQFRIDEYLTFPYMNTTEYSPIQQSTTKTFTYINQMTYNYSLNDNYLVQHYYYRNSFTIGCS
jgi:hypothetical protein